MSELTTRDAEMDAMQEVITRLRKLEGGEKVVTDTIAKHAMAEMLRRYAALEARLALVTADAERLARNTRWFLSRPQSLDSGGLSPSMRERIEGALANHESLNPTRSVPASAEE